MTNERVVAAGAFLVGDLVPGQAAHVHVRRAPELEDLAGRG
jgi:hypothetical protein